MQQFFSCIPLKISDEKIHETKDAVKYTLISRTVCMFVVKTHVRVAVFENTRGRFSRSVDLGVKNSKTCINRMRQSIKWMLNQQPSRCDDNIKYNIVNNFPLRGSKDWLHQNAKKKTHRKGGKNISKVNNSQRLKLRSACG